VNTHLRWTAGDPPKPGSLDLSEEAGCEFVVAVLLAEIAENAEWVGRSEVKGRVRILPAEGNAFPRPGGPTVRALLASIPRPRGRRGAENLRITAPPRRAQRGWASPVALLRS
jgi:hypothetical protein